MLRPKYTLTPERLLIDTYTFFSIRRLTAGWLEGSKAVTVPRSITWDPTETTIISARMYCKIWTQWQSAAHIIFHGSELLLCDATWGDNVCESTVDVTGFLANGTNQCKAEIWKLPGITAAKSAEFTAILEVEYQGVPPVVPPPLPELPEWWWIAALGAIGGVILIAVVWPKPPV